MKIILKNDFHNSEVKLNVKNGVITKDQVKRSKTVLCGMLGCSCSDDLGMRGPQDYFIDLRMSNSGDISAIII